MSVSRHTAQIVSVLMTTAILIAPALAQVSLRRKHHLQQAKSAQSFLDQTKVRLAHMEKMAGVKAIGAAQNVLRASAKFRRQQALFAEKQNPRRVSNSNACLWSALPPQF